MNDMLKNEDQVLVNTIAYNILPVARYDVISFHKVMEDGEKIQYVKRVIGLPGDTILIKDGEFYVNGKKLDYKKSKDKIVNAGLAAEEIKLKDDEYFVIGDNINNSEDSRSATVGNVRKTEIDGKVWLISWPFANINLVK
jgi:signal peptidase I